MPENQFYLIVFNKLLKIFKKDIIAISQANP